MLKSGIVAVATFAVSLGLVAEVSAAPKVTVPDEATEGIPFTITATDCKSGSNFTAEVVIGIYESEPGSLVKDVGPFATDPDGTTDVSVTIDKLGTYRLIVTCRHKFSNGTYGQWYGEEETVYVKQAPEPPKLDDDFDVSVQPRRVHLPPPDEDAFKIKVTISGYNPEDLIGADPEDQIKFKYNVDGPKPFGKEDGQVNADEDGKTTIGLKIKPAFKPGTYTIDVDAVLVSETGTQTIGQETGKVKLLPAGKGLTF